MKSRSRNIMIAVFTIPAMIAIALVFVYPVIRTILMSFFTIDNVVSKMSEWSFVGVSNYTQLLGTPLFRQTWVTFAKIRVFGGLVIMCIAMLFAVILTSGVRGKSFWRAAIHLPNIISAVALANMWIHLCLQRQLGPVPQHLRGHRLGLHGPVPVDLAGPSVPGHDGGLLLRRGGLLHADLHRRDRKDPPRIFSRPPRSTVPPASIPSSTSPCRCSRACSRPP